MPLFLYKDFIVVAKIIFCIHDWPYVEFKMNHTFWCFMVIYELYKETKSAKAEHFLNSMMAIMFVNWACCILHAWCTFFMERCEICKLNFWVKPSHIDWCGKWSWSDGIRKWELIFCSDSVCISSPNDTKSMSKQLVKISSKSFVMHLLAVQWWSCSAVCGFLMMITLNHRAISILL